MSRHLLRDVVPYGRMSARVQADVRPRGLTLQGAP